MISQKEEVITAILDITRFIKSFEIEKDLVREIEFGTSLNFAPIRDTLNKIRECVERVLNCQLSELPFELLNEYRNALQRILDLMDAVKKFHVDSANPIGNRTHLINNIELSYDALIEPSAKLMLYDSAINSTIINEESIKNRLSYATNEINKNIDSSKDRLIELNNILESAKSAVGEVGITVHATLFAEEAQIHRGQAKNWFFVIIALLVAVIIGALLFLRFTPKSDKWDVYAIQFVITKIIVFASVFYALAISLKNYKAHKHNEVVNKHRQNALSTFETFVNSSAEQQTKDAVLLQATMSIFSNQQTGYSSSDNEGDMPSKVIEIIKSAGPVAKG